MPNFNLTSRWATNPDLPVQVRFRALLWSLEAYYWLTGQRFHATYERLGAALGFDWHNRPDAAQIAAAVAMLRAERARFLRKLAAFAEARRARKAAGHRAPSRADTEALYRPDWIEPPALAEFPADRPEDIAKPSEVSS